MISSPVLHVTAKLMTFPSAAIALCSLVLFKYCLANMLNNDVEHGECFNHLAVHISIVTVNMLACQHELLTQSPTVPKYSLMLQLS